jgi:hypothetical protein
MTRIRHYEQDSPFGSWLREQSKSNLPSVCLDGGFTATDVDMIVMRRWQINEVSLQNIMFVEVKTRNGLLKTGQDYIFNALNRFRGVRANEGSKVQFYGVCGLLMSGTSPLDSEKITWCRQPWNKPIRGDTFRNDELSTQISVDTLIKILAWDLHPVSLKKYKPSVKGNHGQTEIVTKETTLLGFEVDRVIIKRW